MIGPRTIAGQVHLLDAVAPGALFRLKVEDVSRLDAAATVIAESQLRLAAGAAAGDQLPFTLALPETSERAQYSVRVHVDVNGSGEITAGDLLSTASYPVAPGDHPAAMQIEARKIS